MAIKHRKQLLRPDGNDPAEAQPSDWNDDHDADGLVGLLLAIAGIPDAFPYIRTDGTAAMAAISTPARAMLAAATNDLILQSIGAVGLNSPHFTGAPTAPTATAGDNSTLLANTAFVRSAIAALVATAPSTLDTLNELAAALGNDPNFATTTATALANRLRFDAAQTLTSPQMVQALANLGVVFGTGANNAVRLDGSSKLPAVDGSALTSVGLGVGQCVLRLVGGNLKLLPYNGNKLTINGVLCTVPDAGVSLAPTGLTVGTGYFIYATQSGGVVNALEAATTAHATSTTAGNKGVEIKSGDDARTLVGFARMITGPAFADTMAQRFVRSWFNDQGVVGENTLATASTASGTTVTFGALTEFLLWANEAVFVIGNGCYYCTIAGPYALQMQYDGSNAFGHVMQSGLNNSQISVAGSGVLDALAEGYHSVNMGGWTGQGTLNVSGINMALTTKRR